jgi:hypothetical protein
MDSKNIFEVNYMGYSYTFNRNPEDTIEDFYNISWIAAKQMPKNQKEFEKAQQMAIIWYYQHKYQCSYPQLLKKSLQEIDLLSMDL